MTDRFRDEAVTTLKLAIPLVIGQATNVAMVFVDTLFAGRLSAEDLAAVAIGGTFWATSNLLVLGTLLAVPAFVSQFDGAGERQRIAPFARQAGWVALLLSLLVWSFIRNAELLLEPIGIPAEVRPLAGGYLDAISWGAPFYALFFLFRFVSEGIGSMRPAMVFGIGGLLLNIVADWVLMYGKFGFPALGAAGCGYATAIVLAAQCIGMGLYLRFGKRYADLDIFKHIELPRLDRAAEILRVGLPIGAAVFVESSLFLCATLLMGSLGTVMIAGHQIALNFSALAFMVPLGFSFAITVRVGNAAGRGDWEAVRFRGITGLKLIMITQTITALFILTFRGPIAGLYSTDAAVVAVGVELLLFGALFQFSDGFQIAAAGALRGIKDTRIPLVIMVLAYWVFGIPLSYTLGISLGGRGAGIWIGLIGGLTVAAVALLWRFNRLSQRLVAGQGEQT
ncbi:MAG: MATE family efflux transporter [Pseudomonadota bacterium]